MASEQAKELRKQGIAAAKAGQKEQARKLLQQALRLEPNNEAAWLWVASVAKDERERLFCLHKLLEINPTNEMGLQALGSLGISREQLAARLAVVPATKGTQETPVVQHTSGARPPEPQTPPPAAPQAPGVPIMDTRRLSEISGELDAIIRDYLQPTENYAGVRWVKKSKGRAGESDSTVLSLYLAGGAVVALLLLIGVVALVVWNTPSLRGIVFAPTWTITPTPLPPTLTPTPTPGVTPTPSPTPELTLTPSPTVPPSLPDAARFPPQSTAIYPKPSDRGLQDAIGLLDAGNLEIALPTLEFEVTQAAQRFDAQPYYYAGLALADSGQLDAAKNLLTAAENRLLESDNPTDRGLINAALAYVDLKLAEQASTGSNLSQIGALLTNVTDRSTAAITADPKLELPYLLLAKRFAMEQDYDRAIAALDNGLSVPELAANTRMLLQKGDIYFQQGEYERAAYQAFLVLYVDPPNEKAHLLQIYTAMAQNKPGLAVLQTQAYLFYYPGSAAGYKLLGDARVAEGNTDLALEAYSQALAGGDDVPTLLARSALYTQRKFFEQAYTDLTHALTLSDDPAIRALRMHAAYASGSGATALSDAEALAGTSVVPDSELSLLRAQVLIDNAAPFTAVPGQLESATQNDLEQALELLTNAANALPENQHGVVDDYRARALYALGKDYPAALNAVNSALQNAETGGRRYLRGLIYAAQDKPELAAREFDWVVSLGSLYSYPFLAEARQRLETLNAAAKSN